VQIAFRVDASLEEYLARHRGFSVGVMAAEAFVTIRTIK
jgi:hypothetical protein